MRLTTWSLSIVLAGLVSRKRECRRSHTERPMAGVTATPVQTATAVHLDGRLAERTWAFAPTITEFVQRDPKEGPPPPFAPRRGWRTTRDLYVAVRAFDREPDRIVGIRTRRDPHSPSDWVAGDHRLVPRSADGLRVRREPVGREAGPLLVQRRQRATRAGTPCGTCRCSTTRRVAGGVPHSVLAAAVRHARAGDTFGLRASSGRSAG